MNTSRISGIELDRLKILSDVLIGKLTLKEASHALHLSYRQAIRLKKKVKEQGIEGLLKKAPLLNLLISKLHRNKNKLSSLLGKKSTQSLTFFIFVIN